MRFIIGSIQHFGSKTYLFGEIPEKPPKHPLIPVLNFKKLDKNEDIIDIDEKKKELGSDYPEAKV